MNQSVSTSLNCQSFFALQAKGIQVVDGQQIFLEARRIKTADELTLLTSAASMVDAAYEKLYEFPEAWS